VALISSVLFLTPYWGETLETQIFAVAIGVLVAGVAQAIFQWPNLRREGFSYRWVSPWDNETVREVVRKMIPGMMGVAAFQINVLITNGVAFYVDKQIVASFDYAVRLMELPQGMFGISLATYLLPTLAGLAAEKKYPEFRATLGQGLSHLVFMNLIASILLVILATPIIRLIFEHGKFTEFSTQRASLALTFLAPGLIAFSMVNILARGFYALGDTQTPMKISIVCLALNLVFAMLVVSPLRQAGLGLANSLSAIFNVGLLFYALRRKLKFLELGELRRNIAPLLVAATFAGIAAWLTSRYWEKSIGHENLAEKIGAVFVPMTLAAVIYFAIALLMKIPSAREIFNLVMEKLRLRNAQK
jgi:putative peptidoglycan lipid II flippase